MTGILFSTLYAKEADEFKTSPTPSNIYKAIHDTTIPTLTRPLMSAPFDMITISRQVTGNSYAGIVKGFNTQYAPILSKVLKVHSVEMTLRSSVYFLYSYTTQQTKQCAPDLCAKYPLIPEITAVSIIALCDLGFANPFERMKVCFMNNLPIPFYRDEKLVLSDLVRNNEWLFRGV